MQVDFRVDTLNTKGTYTTTKTLGCMPGIYLSLVESYYTIFSAGTAPTTETKDTKVLIA